MISVSCSAQHTYPNESIMRQGLLGVLPASRRTNYTYANARSLAPKYGEATPVLFDFALMCSDIFTKVTGIFDAHNAQ